jgi:hypothetical protein
MNFMWLLRDTFFEPFFQPKKSGFGYSINRDLSTGRRALCQNMEHLWIDTDTTLAYVPPEFQASLYAPVAQSG